MGRSAEMWSDVRSAVAGAVRRVDPVVLFGLGVLVMAVLFGALALTALGDADGFDDLELRSPGAPPAERADGADAGDVAGGGDVPGGGGGHGQGGGLSSPAHEPGASTTTPALAEGTAGGGASAPWPAAGEPPAGAPGTGTSTSAPAPATTTSSTTTAPPTTAPTTTAPPTTPSTTAPVDEGLFGTLLDVLSPGG